MTTKSRDICIFDCLKKIIFLVFPHFEVLYVNRKIQKKIDDIQACELNIDKKYQDSSDFETIMSLNKKEVCDRLKEENSRKDKINNKILQLSGFLSVIVTLLGNNISTLFQNTPNYILNNHILKLIYIIVIPILLLIYILTILLCGIWSVKTSPSYGIGSVHYLNVRKNKIILLKKDLYCAEKGGTIRHNVNNLLAGCYSRGLIIITCLVVLKYLSLK